MADAKISELTAMDDIATGDLIPIVDVSATATEKITFENFSNAQVAYVSVNTDSNAVTVGGALVRSGYYINKHATASTAVTYTLPTAVAGMQFCFKNSRGAGGANTGALTIHPAADAYIEMDGTETHAVHHNVSSSGAAGDMITLLAVDSTHWSVIGRTGSWTLEA